jgi:hypothetical protein
MIVLHGTADPGYRSSRARHSWRAAAGDDVVLTELPGRITTRS